ncbi:unnamed protein product [Paramecium sonneborni]|uniref:Uncharacterized protein n=1 Tax=Paramecium sonneborni TaxID=65129 RepID=A0A8S1RNE2_9CILI|nr:unnamed protein product [Paramecium sonneborni]
MDMPEEMKQFKITLVGNTQVGKTHLCSRLVLGKLPKVIIPTIGVEFAQKKYQLSNNQQINLQIWDTSGQERYKQISLPHLKKAKGIYLVYDITKKATFDQLEEWLDNIRQIADPDVTIMIIGNKLDKVINNDELREVQLEQVKRFADLHKLTFMEISVYSDEDVEKCLTKMVEEICNSSQVYSK